jgi:1,4-dihydroxy-2-naphthoate octaprenyltransferase
MAELQRIDETEVARMLAEGSTLTLASGTGRGIWTAAMYYLEDGTDLYCIVKPAARTLENFKVTPRVAFSVERGGPGFYLQGVGHAIVMGPVADEPDVKERALARTPQIARIVESEPDSLLIKIVVERYFATMDDSAPGSRAEYVTEAGMKSIPPVALWARAVRAFSFTASLIPPTVGAMLAFMHETPAKWALFPLVLVASVSYHAGTNLVNDYYDFRNNVDRRGTLGSSGLLVQGLIPARSILRGAVVFFSVGTLIGLYFVSVRGVPMLILGLVGLLGGYFYTAGPINYKYKGVGEPLVFLLMGPLMVVGSYLVLTGSFRWDVVLVSLPVGCLVAAILQSNDLRDIAYDNEVGIKTAAIVFGGTFAEGVYHALVISAYIIVAVLAALRILPVWSLAVLVTLPAAARNMRIVRRIAAGASREYATIDVLTAQLHMAFGLVLIASLAAGRLL